MTEEEKMDEMIRNAVSDYNRPPATPVDEMWSAIQAAQQSAGPRLQVVAGGAAAGRDELRHGARRFSSSYAWMGMAAAALFLVASGVGIGRWTNRSASDSPNNERRIAANPAPVPSNNSDEIGPSAPATIEPSHSGEVAAPAASRSREDIRKNPIIVGQRTVRPVGPTKFASANGAYPQSAAVYQVATARNLADAEALLTSFSIGSRDPQMDAQFADWAKGLLSNTRLLLDSPAGDDPHRAKLLQDLEQVLAQIAQLSPNARAQDRELIQGSIVDGHVMTRLRTAIPAGSPRDILER